MRLLVTFAGGYGHFVPLIPLARAAAAAGHTVAVAGRPAQVANVEAAGFVAFASGDPALDPSPARPPLRPIDPEVEDRVFRDGFAGVVARDRAGALLELADHWSPDLVLCDEVDFGAMVAAERLGLPHASVVSMPAGTFVRPALIAEPIARLRAEHGLAPDPDLAMTRRHLVLVPAPPSFRDPSVPLPATARSIRPASPDPDADSFWSRNRAGSSAPGGSGTTEPGRARVYVSLGTAFNVESGDLFSRVIAGLRGLSVDVLVTVGNEIDPAELDPQPANVIIERFVPQWTVLSQCDLVVSHGGSGGVIGALAHGLPVVVLPLGADQPHNAARVEALGVGKVRDAVTATPGEISESVDALLGDARARAAAASLRDDCARLPSPAEAVAWLEALV